MKIVQWLAKEDCKKNFLVYCGSPGIGKTYLCSALIPWIVRKYPCFRYYNERELLRKVRESFDQSSGDYLTILKYLIDDPFIMIDDIGSEKYTEWREEVLFETIDQRYNSMLPTVFTSNFTKDQMKKIYHPRLSDRLFASENTVIEFSNENASFRQIGL